MKTDFNFEHFNWCNKIDKIFYEKNEKDISITIIANNTTKNILVPIYIFNHVLKAFRDDEVGTINYLIDYSVKHLFENILNNYCSWNNDEEEIDFNEILINITDKIQDIDSHFKQYIKNGLN